LLTIHADICERVKYLHVPLDDADTEVVMKELVAQHGEGGVTALDRQGHVATPFNANGMMHPSCATMDKSPLKSGSDRTTPAPLLHEFTG